MARDGYDALMKGDDKVISGLKNKVMIGATTVAPEYMVAGTNGQNAKTKKVKRRSNS